MLCKAALRNSTQKIQGRTGSRPLNCLFVPATEFVNPNGSPTIFSTFSYITPQRTVERRKAGPLSAEVWPLEREEVFRESRDPWINPCQEYADLLPAKQKEFSGIGRMELNLAGFLLNI